MGRRRALGVAVVLALAGLGLAPTTTADGAQPWRGQQIDPAAWLDGPALKGSPMDEPQAGDPVLSLEVSYAPDLGQGRVSGRIVIELFEAWAPITVTNNLGLTDDGFYDGTIWHRIIDDFVIQGGDPNTKDANPANDGSGGSGETIPLEIDDNLTHVDGAVGMARDTDPDSAESQFYICDEPQHQLDHVERQQLDPPESGYAVFGVVRDGMSHVRAMAQVPTTNRPLTDLARPPGLGPDRPIEDVDLVRAEIIGVVAGAGPAGPGEKDGGIGPSVPLAWTGIGAVAMLAAAVMRGRAAHRPPDARHAAHTTSPARDARDGR